MDTHAMLVELLAIKLFEHTPLGSGEQNRMSWSEADPADRQMVRDQITGASDPEQLYVVEP